MSTDPVRLSKFLSLILRHKPETIGLRPDEQGWVEVNALLIALNERGMSVDLALLQRVVDINDKRRFAFSDDGLRIRASQGHSIAVDLALPAVVPPAVLYHGTAVRFLDSIRVHGLRPASRRHVHLSADVVTALQVGARHGSPIVLTVDAAAMHGGGLLFYRSANGVWLTDTVPPVYLRFPNSHE